MNLNQKTLVVSALLLVLIFSSCKDQPTGGEPEEELPQHTTATVTTSEIDDVTAITANTGGNVTDDGNTAISGRGVCWSTAEEPTTNDSCTDDGNGIGSYSSSIENLEPETQYFVRAYATNSEGTAYGNERSFTTLPDAVEDIDGNIYDIIQIGEQLWMAENLKVTTYRDGSALPTLSNPEWFTTTSGAYAVYPSGEVPGIDSNQEMIDAYGVLYNWFAVNDERELCPVDWHIPTDEDWSELSEFIAGEDIGNKLKDCRQDGSPLGGNCDTNEHPRWSSHDTHHGTDAYGFSVLPGGRRDTGGTFVFLGTEAWLWSSSETDGSDAISRRLINQTGDFLRNTDSDKRLGLAVRCVMVQ